MNTTPEAVPELGREERRALLLENTWLQDLPDHVIDRLAAATRQRILTDGSLLYRRGDQAEGLYKILSGSIRIGANAADGRQSVLALLEPGHWFGEISLLDGRARTHDAHAHGEAVILMVPRRDFLQLLEDRPEVYRFFVPLLCQRLRQVFSLLEDHAFLSVRARLSKRLLLLAHRFGDTPSDGQDVVLDISQEALGTMLGLTRQTVNKELGQLARAGLVRLRYGRIALKDVQELRELVRRDG